VLYQQKSKYFFSFFFALFFFIINASAHASWLDGVKPSATFLPVDSAFSFSHQWDETTHQLKLHWKVTPGYYLYQDKFKITTQNATLGTIEWPQASQKIEPEIGTLSVYEHDLTIEVPVTSIDNNAFNIEVEYQGCSAQGYCYPPVKQIIALTSAPHSSQTSDLQTHQILTLLSFFGAGLLLSFTPCVLPMLPILSSILMDKQRQTKYSRFYGAYLSSLYVLSASVIYTILGVVAGLTGDNLQAHLQAPWILITLSVLFVLLALSLFDVYQLPSFHRFQQKLHMPSRFNHPVLKAIILGCFSALVVTPCITPPLVGALAYISQSRDAVLGGLALFCLGLGMGLPLIIIGTFGTQFLPKTGKWMNYIKYLFGILLLLVAASLLWRLFPMTSSETSSSTMQTVNENTLSFEKISTLPALQLALQKNKYTVVYFTADWCISCQILKKTTFADTNVLKAAQQWQRLEVDMTHDTTENSALLKHYQVFAPPTLLFFDNKGQELSSERLVGDVTSLQLLSVIKQHE